MLLTEWLLYQIIFAGETNSCPSDILLPQQLRLLLNFIFVERSISFNFSSKRLFLTSFVMPQRLAKCLVASIKSSCCGLFFHVVCVEGERGGGGCRPFMISRPMNGAKYSRMDQLKFVEDSL